MELTPGAFRFALIALGLIAVGIVGLELGHMITGVSAFALGVIMVISTWGRDKTR